jgi:hypothetical protein
VKSTQKTAILLAFPLGEAHDGGTMKTNPSKATAKVAKAPKEPKSPSAKAAPKTPRKAVDVPIERVKPEDVPRGRLVAVQAAPYSPPPVFVKRKPVGS